jgi:hypothetical protein
MKRICLEFEKWSLDYEVNDDGNVPIGGIILKKVVHDHYNLAKDMRVVAIWIDDLETPVILGSEVCPCTEAIEIKSYPAESAPDPFDGFKIVGLMRQKFKTKYPMHGKGSAYLEITQTFLFTTYDLNPAHEPFAVLQAARIFPLVHFKFSNDNDIEIEKVIKTIRIDYRLHNCLDFFIDPLAKRMDPLLANLFPTEMPGSPNMAGIFRDYEDPSLFANLLWALWGTVEGVHPGRRMTEEALFYAGEKPMQFEICSFGLMNGRPFGDKGFVTWDNIHQWGGYKNYKKLPSTPGAFHAAHLHWRWGLSTQEQQKFYMQVPSAGEHQFGRGWDSVMGGPLLDPKIPLQTIRFAVTKSNSDDDDYNSADPRNANKAPSEKKYSDLFYTEGNEQSGLSDIMEGEDLVTWLSFDVKRTHFHDPFEGTVFIHGLYFAHNLEQGWFFTNPSAMSRDEAAPRKKIRKPKWNRNPEDKDFQDLNK